MNTTFRNLRFLAVLYLLVAFSPAAFADYCIPNYGFGPGANDYIDGVVLGDISNFTGAGAEYNDYTGLSTTIAPGSTHTLTIHNTPAYTEYYATWIDWNQDEVFTDDERLNAENLIIVPGGTGNITFTAPFTALPGSTRMRVMCVYFPAGLIDACGAGGIYSYGEAEDYTINVPSGASSDIGVSAIAPVEGTCGLGLTPVTVTISNYGSETADVFQVRYTLVHPVLGALTPVTEAYTGVPIAEGETAEFTFATLADYSTAGTYSITVLTILAGDGVAANDDQSSSVNSVPLIATYPYQQNFEAGAAFWTTGGVLSSWELGDPDGDAISGPPPAAPTSLKSWTTELDDNYNLNEQSYVISPCFDFSSLILPSIEFDANWDIQLFDDGAKLQYSLDQGMTWNDLGALGTGINWYNHASCYAMWPNFYVDNYNGWSGSSEGWVHAEHDLSMLAGEPSVVFRFTFSSSPFWNFNDGFAFDNVHIHDANANDIGITDVTDPVSSAYLGTAESITVEVMNFGTTPKSGFNVKVQVNGGTVFTEVYTGTLNPGESGLFTFATTFNMSADGNYTIHAFTALPGDGDVSNDNYTETVTNLTPVTGSGAFYIYSVETGFEPYATTSNSEHMNSVFGVGGWTQTTFEACVPSVIFSEDNCFVYLDGSSDHALALEDFLEDNMTLIENWVASGGHLFLNSSPDEGDGMSFGFGGTQLQYVWYTTDVQAYDVAHPIWSGPFTPVTPFMSGETFGTAEIIGEDLIPLIIDAYNPEKIVAAEKNWGAGTVVFGGMLVTDYQSPLTEAANLRKNLISYLSSCAVNDIDAGVLSIVSPSTNCGLSATEHVTINVRNYGFEPITNIPVHVQVDGGAIIDAVVATTIEPGTSFLYTFAATSDFSAVGDHTIVAWTTMPLDVITDNDQKERTITHIPYVTSYPYNQDWESGIAEGWRTYGAVNTWELGMPDGPVINTAPPATPGSDYSWATNLDGLYNNSEISYLESPCFDLSLLIFPYVEFDIWWETEALWDGLVMESSIDGGASWSIVGGIGTGDNWYNDIANAVSDEGAWAGSSGGWFTAHHDLTSLAGNESVKLRFHFAADAINNFDGVSIDNFLIRDPEINDIGVSELISPVSGLDLTAAETVSVLVQNYGTLPQSGFTVSYQLDGLGTVTEDFIGTLPAGGSAVHTFAGTIDLGTPGVYTICSWTDLDIDTDITNDSISGCATVIHYEPIDGTGAQYVYSSEIGVEPGISNPVSTAMDAVFGADNWDLNYYETVNPYTLFSGDNCFIYLEGSELHWTAFETFINDNLPLIEGWVSAGGHLYISANAYTGDGGFIGFEDLGITYPSLTSTTTAVDAAHPVYSGAFGTVTDAYSGTYVSNAHITGSITPIMRNEACDACYIMGEKLWGSGKVFVNTLGAPDYCTPADEAQLLLQNTIDYIKLCSPVDAGVTAIINPTGGCAQTAAETVTVTVFNYGPTPLTDIPVMFSVNGLLVGSESIAGPLASGDEVDYTFTTTADLSAPGSYTIEAWTTVVGDYESTNDMFTTTVVSLETPVVELGENLSVCDEVTLDAGNPGSDYLWSTGETTQTITVTASGDYTVTVTNPVSGCTANDAISVTITYSPDASFTYVTSELTVDFTNTSTGGDAYDWDFGDGGSSSEENPSHTYTTDGSYSVTLTVTNDCGTDTYSEIIEVADAIAQTTLQYEIEVYPNPTTGYINIECAQLSNIQVQLLVFNTIGEQVLEPTSMMNGSGIFTISLATLPAGIYQIHIITTDGSTNQQVILTK